VLGSTGSVGAQALSVVESLGGEFSIWGLSAHDNAELLLEQAHRFRPACVALTGQGAAERIRGRLPEGVRLFSGTEGLLRICGEAEGCADMAVIAIVGIAGLPVVAECIKAGLDIALANKEPLVAGGGLVNELLAAHGRKLYPVDSEHSAIFQCLQGLSSHEEVKRILLTASGGPFHGYTRDMLSSVTAEQALRHPNWSMGVKVTIDSATLMNKGLEVIEAHWLFGMPASAISVVIHRQSVIHSMVELVDGSVLAQLGCADMRMPIQYALTYPRRMPCPAPALDVFEMGPLTFSRPDMEAFPCLGLAYEALKLGGGAAVAMNAANEVAVDKFMRGSISFNDIPVLVEKGMKLAPSSIDERNLGEIMALDKEIRKVLL
jgi:1-deoxy-D-xylulose-5-phosphate reductoisomerase